MSKSNVELGLVVQPNKNLPEAWDYNESVTKVRTLITSFKTIAPEMLHELWVAREMLSRERGSGVAITTLTWGGYCTDIGLGRSTAHRWLKQYDPVKKKKKLPKPTAPTHTSKKEIEEAQKNVQERYEAKKGESTEPKPETSDSADEVRIRVIQEMLDAEPTFTLSTGEEVRNQDELVSIVKKYLAAMESDSRRLEAVHNLIKWLRVKATEYQQRA